MSVRNFLGGLSQYLQAVYSSAQSWAEGGGLGFLSGNSHCSGPTLTMGFCVPPAGLLSVARIGTGFPV